MSDGWTCPRCGNAHPATATGCACGGWRPKDLPPVAADTPEAAVLPPRRYPADPPLKTAAERQRADAAARRILDLVGDLGGV